MQGHPIEVTTFALICASGNDELGHFDQMALLRAKLEVSLAWRHRLLHLVSDWTGSDEGVQHTIIRPVLLRHDWSTKALGFRLYSTASSSLGSRLPTGRGVHLAASRPHPRAISVAVTASVGQTRVCSRNLDFLDLLEDLDDDDFFLRWGILPANSCSCSRPAI